MPGSVDQVRQIVPDPTPWHAEGAVRQRLNIVAALRRDEVSEGRREGGVLCAGELGDIDRDSSAYALPNSTLSTGATSP